MFSRARKGGGSGGYRGGAGRVLETGSGRDRGDSQGERVAEGEGWETLGRQCRQIHNGKDLVWLVRPSYIGKQRCKEPKGWSRLGYSSCATDL